MNQRKVLGPDPIEQPEVCTLEPVCETPIVDAIDPVSRLDEESPQHRVVHLG